MKQLNVVELVIPTFEKDDIHKVSYMWLDTGLFYYVSASNELVNYLYSKGYLTSEEYNICNKADSLFIYFK